MDKLIKKPVKNFMTKDVIAVKKEDSIKNVFKLMDENEILGIPVVDDDNQPIGMVTESDLIKHFTTIKTPKGINLLGSIVFLDDISKFNENLKDHCAESVGDIMTDVAITINEDTQLIDAIDLMAQYNLNRLPVVDKKNKLTGIITRTDIVHQLAKSKHI
ncbi:CBS domain-containing protein [Patescibacteria group bacterium]|nr:CBS domain-containing protein [Patescibacteria group bacterium]MBU1934562.1 CBS domain-containing protein [Patescibacteria group bacterium]